MVKYKQYNIEPDIFKQRKHLYYLGALVEDKNEEHIIASYSLKTKQLLIKNANLHIPPEHILREFVETCELKGEKDATKIKNLPKKDT